MISYDKIQWYQVLWFINGNWSCRQGRYNLDPSVKFFATPPVHGSLARYVDHPADFCFKLPDSLSYEQGAMVEPLSNAGALPPQPHAAHFCNET